MISTDNIYRSHTCSVLLKMTQKTCHSTAEALIFMAVQKLRLYTQKLTHNDMPKLNYHFFDTPCTGCLKKRLPFKFKLAR